MVAGLSGLANRSATHSALQKWQLKTTCLSPSINATIAARTLITSNEATGVADIMKAANLAHG